MFITTFVTKLMVVTGEHLSGNRSLTVSGVRGCNQLTPTGEYVAKSAR
jgi:hypothetical protein